MPNYSVVKIYRNSLRKSQNEDKWISKSMSVCCPFGQNAYDYQTRYKWLIRRENASSRDSTTFWDVRRTYQALLAEGPIDFLVSNELNSWLLIIAYSQHEPALMKYAQQRRTA